jgi:hypothetical protein
MVLKLLLAEPNTIEEINTPNAIGKIAKLINWKLSNLLRIVKLVD